MHTRTEFTIGSVFVQHERASGLDLGLQDGIPELLRFDRLPCSSLLFVPFVELLEFFAPNLVLIRSFSGAEERPVAISLYSLHAK